MIVELFNELQMRLPPGTPLYLGRQYVAQHDTPPRLVLYPIGERFIPPDRAQLQPGRALWSREVAFELHVWGNDYAQCESMLAEIVTALQGIGGTSFQLINATWNAEEWQQLGQLLTVLFNVTGPLLRAETFAVLEEIAHECAGFITG